jgi:hypothetical protein
MLKGGDIMKRFGIPKLNGTFEFYIHADRNYMCKYEHYIDKFGGFSLS